MGRLKCLATGLDAFLASFSTSRRCSRNGSPSRLPVSSMYNCKKYKSSVDGIGWGTGEMIIDLDGALGSRYFLNVEHKRTWIDLLFGMQFLLKSYLCFCHIWMKSMEKIPLISGSFWSNLKVLRLCNVLYHFSLDISFLHVRGSCLAHTLKVPRIRAYHTQAPVPHTCIYGCVCRVLLRGYLFIQ